MRVPIGVPVGGVWGRVQGGGGKRFPVENKEKGEGGGEGGVGTGKGTGKSMRKLCRHYPVAIYPLVYPLEHRISYFIRANLRIDSRESGHLSLAARRVPKTESSGFYKAP